MPYSTLNADLMEATIRKLQARIDERFPERGLSRLCAHLLEVAQEDRRKLSWVARPNFWVRGAVGGVLVLGVVGLTWSFVSLGRIDVEVEAFNILQGIEALINVVALAGAAIWFLLNLEATMRRENVLANLHQLRSIAHVVDMHQLTKDPTTLLDAYTVTPSSEPHHMNEFQLMRYLDYCTEMLSLTGKLAALYLQGTRDPVIIDTVSEIEDLTTNLSRKIWQKVMIIHRSQEIAAR